MNSLTTEKFVKEIFDYQNEKEWKYKGEKPVVLKFSANWCAPCKSYAPIVEKVSNEMDDIKFYSVDVDDEPEIAEVFKVRSIPTTFFIPLEGKPHSISGLIPKDRLTNMINHYLK